MRASGILRKHEVRQFIRAEIAKADQFIEFDSRFIIFYLKNFDRYIILSKGAHRIVNDANGYGFRSIESAERMIQKIIANEQAEAIDDYAGYDIYDL